MVGHTVNSNSVPERLITLHLIKCFLDNNVYIASFHVNYYSSENMFTIKQYNMAALKLSKSAHMVTM